MEKTNGIWNQFLDRIFYNPELEIPVCPKCNSIEVKDRGMISQRAYSRLHICTSCGFQGPLFPHMKLKDAIKLEKKDVKFNPSYMPMFADTVPTSKSKFSDWAYIFLVLVLIFIFAMFVTYLFVR